LISLALFVKGALSTDPSVLNRPAAAAAALLWPVALPGVIVWAILSQRRGQAAAELDEPAGVRFSMSSGN
jgi:hypothetical protein